MKYGLRLKVMHLLGLATHRLGNETRQRQVRQQDEERTDTFGDVSPAIDKGQLYAAELDALAMRVASS